MLKLFLKKHKKKGFTLTETIVVIALLALIMTCIVGFAEPVRNSVAGANARADAVTINKILGNYLEHKLSFADYVNVKIGYDIYNSTTGKLYKDNCIENAVNGKGGKGGLETTAGKNYTPYSGVLIFHFDSNKGSFRMYDINASIGLDKLKELHKITDLSPYQVFTDDFYSRYSYFFTCDPTPVRNPTKNKVYMTFEIDSYDFGAGYDSLMTANTTKEGETDMAKEYYQRTLANDTSESVKAFDDIASSRTGTEKVTFSFENISSDSTGKIEVEYPKKPDPSDSSKEVADIEGSDVLIFYTTRRYKVG